MKIWILCCVSALLMLGCQMHQQLPDTTGIPATHVDYTDRTAFLKAQRPGAFHQLLDGLTGNWQLQGSGYLLTPTPNPTSGNLQVNWILNDNWLEMNISEATSGSGDTAFVRQYIGFDNLRQRYFLWSMATWSVTAQLYVGEWNEKAKSWEFSRTAIVLRDGKLVSFEAIIRISMEDEHRMVWELWEQWHTREIHDGKPIKLWHKAFAKM